MKSAKDVRDPLSYGGIYKVLCSYANLHIDTQNTNICIYLTFASLYIHKQYSIVGQPEKSDVVEHVIANV